jgi:hypothetical protein
MATTYIICSICGDSISAEGYAGGRELSCDVCKEPEAGDEASNREEERLDDDYEIYADLDRERQRR